MSVQTRDALREVTDSAPLIGRRIVVTRPEEDNGTLSKALNKAGAEVVFLPMVRIVPAEAPSMPVDAAAIRAYDRILFTSANGVTAYHSRLDESARLAFAEHTGVAVVGPATERALVKIGAHASVIASPHVAEALAEALGDVQGLRILWPRAAGARPVLADLLRERDAVVEDFTVYSSVAADPDSGAKPLLDDADLVTFTSPSCVNAFVRAFGVIEKQRVVCIGPVTAAAAKVAGLRIDAVASVFTLEGLIAAVIEALSTESTRGMA